MNRFKLIFWRLLQAFWLVAITKQVRCGSRRSVSEMKPLYELYAHQLRFSHFYSIYKLMNEKKNHCLKLKKLWGFAFHVNWGKGDGISWDLASGSGSHNPDSRTGTWSTPHISFSTFNSPPCLPHLRNPYLTAAVPLLEPHQRPPSQTLEFTLQRFKAAEGKNNQPREPQNFKHF